MKIQLTQGKFAIVDDEDYDALSKFKWTHSGGYAYRLKTTKGISKKVWLHRVINNTPEGLFTDHINGDRLDCRKINLRTCTQSQNNKNASKRKDNSSGFRGVYWFKLTNNYRANISVNGKRICLGFYSCPKKAAQAYNLAATKHHKDFARLNIVEFNLSEVV